MIGKPVKTIDRLKALVDQKKAVYHSNWKVKPAIIIYNMPCIIVHRLVKSGMLFEYRAKKKPRGGAGIIG